MARDDSTTSGTPQMPRHAYAHLNLMCNPFGEIPAEERPPLVVAELDELVRDVGRPGFALQVIGESGRGKTSELLAVAARFPEARYVRVELDVRIRIPEAPLLIVDELQHLSRFKRRRLFARRALSLVVGTHEDVTEELREAGFDVRTHRPACELTVERIEEIFRRRIEWARRAPGPVPMVPRHTVERLMGIAGDDIRAMEGMLYDAVQRAEEVGYVEV